jgi:hypothetical protein
MLLPILPSQSNAILIVCWGKIRGREAKKSHLLVQIFAVIVSKGNLFKFDKKQSICREHIELPTSDKDS